MRPKIILQTLLLSATWLFLQNFNTISPKSPTPEFAGKSSYKIKKVVLDAGHGGKDPGCIGPAKTQEKHNALAIVLKTGRLIRQYYPDVEVIYTREKDVFVELKERAAIANRQNADLFISVHCNAVGAAHIHGAETYVMGLHTAAENLEVAKRENAAIYLETDYKKNYGDYDPNSPEAHIFGSIWQSAYLEQSILFAAFVQEQTQKWASRQDKGVRQAGFLVLRETAMPSVLIETGYMTHRAEEAFLASEEGRDQMARAIFEAFKQYKMHTEGPTAVAQTPQPLPSKTPPAVQKPQTGPIVKPVAATVNAPQPPPSKTPAPVQKSQTDPITKPAAAVNAPQPPPAQIAAPPIAQEAPPQPTGYRILLMSWPNRMDCSSGKLALLQNISEEKIDGNYHYFIGTFAARTEAEKMLAEVRNLGFSNASLHAVQ
jgi:N-acetylmuramoyl-L-alanine amidase